VATDCRAKIKGSGLTGVDQLAVRIYPGLHSQIVQSLAHEHDNTTPRSRSNAK
jgi:hypothetical protein